MFESFVYLHTRCPVVTVCLLLVNECDSTRSRQPGSRSTSLRSSIPCNKRRCPCQVHLLFARRSVALHLTRNFGWTCGWLLAVRLVRELLVLVPSAWCDRKRSVLLCLEPRFSFCLRCCKTFSFVGMSERNPESSSSVACSFWSAAVSTSHSHSFISGLISRPCATRSSEHLPPFLFVCGEGVQRLCQRLGRKSFIEGPCKVGSPSKLEMCQISRSLPL